MMDKDFIEVEAVDNSVSWIEDPFPRLSKEPPEIERIYNDAGQVVEERCYAQSELLSTYSYRYNEAGDRLVHRTVMHHSEFKCSEVMFYDEMHRCEKKVYIDSDRQYRCSFYKYDDRGNDIEVTATDIHHAFQGKVCHEYGADNRRIRSYYYDNPQQWHHYITYAYDEYWRLIRQNYYDQSGILYRKELFQRDAAGKVIARKNYVRANEE